MTTWMLLAYLALAASLLRSMLVAAEKVPRACARCGLQVERRSLGERVCNCRH